MNLHPLIALSKLPLDTPVEVNCPAFATHDAESEADDYSLIVYRDADGVRGWLNSCPHAGRRLDYVPGAFVRSKQGHLLCAVHGACFQLQDGLCVDGPCRGSHLYAVALQLQDETVYVQVDSLP